MATHLKDFIVDKKTGNLVRDQSKMNTSAKIKQRTSKKQRAVSPAKAGLKA